VNKRKYKKYNRESIRKSKMDIPLQFHEFSHLNHLERCLKFSEIIQRAEVNLTDIDALYTDLETLQGASNIRLRRLEDEMKILNEWSDKKDRGKAEIDLEFMNTVSSGKRARQERSEDTSKVSKKQKTDESSKTSGSKNKSKGKNETHEGGESSNVSKPKIAFDVSNKFWSYVEPYCADITPENITLLENSLSCKLDTNDYFKIPPLGKHYTEIWAKEDMVEETQQVSKLEKKRTTNTSSKSSSSETEHEVDVEEASPYGSFTQRLVSALVDENIMAPMTGNEMQDVKITDVNAPNSKTDGKSTKKNLCYKSLENAIKDQLFSLGLIDSLHEEEHELDAGDEILSELQKCQGELRALVNHNKVIVNKLTEYATNAMKKQEVKQKAKEIDAELVDTFRRFSSSKAKKKGVSRKDKELAWKTLRERETIWKMVDSNETETA